MNKLKLIAMAGLLAAISFTSCMKGSDGDKVYPVVSNFNIAMSGAQVYPPNASTATGRIEASYDRKAHMLSYKIIWSGLSSTVKEIHVHGLAPAGSLAIAPFTNGLIQQITSGFPTATSGTYSGTLYVDGTVVKESDLLAGQFYIDIHTTNYPVTTTGEIRGQLTF